MSINADDSAIKRKNPTADGHWTASNGALLAPFLAAVNASGLSSAATYVIGVLAIDIEQIALAMRDDQRQSFCLALRARLGDWSGLSSASAARLADILDEGVDAGLLKPGKISGKRALLPRELRP